MTSAASLPQPSHQTRSRRCLQQYRHQILTRCRVPGAHTKDLAIASQTTSAVLVVLQLNLPMAMPKGCLLQVRPKAARIHGDRTAMSCPSSPALDLRNRPPGQATLSSARLLISLALGVFWLRSCHLFNRKSLLGAKALPCVGLSLLATLQM